MYTHRKCTHTTGLWMHFHILLKSQKLHKTIDSYFDFIVIRRRIRRRIQINKPFSKPTKNGPTVPKALLVRLSPDCCSAANTDHRYHASRSSDIRSNFARTQKRKVLTSRGGQGTSDRLNRICFGPNAVSAWFNFDTLAKCRMLTKGS